MPLNEWVIEVRNASKALKRRQVLEQIQLQVAMGECVGISGPNGAGKSMLLRLLTGLIYPDQGEVRIFGYRLGRDVEFAPHTGALIDRPGFLPHRSGLYNLELLASIQGRITKQRIIETMEMVGLDAEDRRPVRTYSTGMLQRLGIAQAIMESPRLLLVDEPTRGLDPAGADQIVRLLHDLHSKGTTMVLVSHRKDLLGPLCQRWFTMWEGKLHSEDRDNL